MEASPASQMLRVPPRNPPPVLGTAGPTGRQVARHLVLSTPLESSSLPDPGIPSARDPICKEPKSSRGAVNAAPPKQVTSKGDVAGEPAAEYSKPAGTPHAAAFKLPRTGETGARGSHCPIARPGSLAGVSAPITGASKSEPKVEEGQPRRGSVAAPLASISSRALPSETWPAGSASARTAASRERGTWIGRAALLCKLLFLLCLIFGGDRPLLDFYQAGQDTASAARSGVCHNNSSSSALYSPATSLWAQQSAAAAAVGSPVAFSAAATSAAREANAPLSIASTLAQQAGSEAPTTANTARTVAFPKQAAMVACSPAVADQPWPNTQLPAAAAGQLAGAALHQAASGVSAEQPAAQALRQAPAGSPGAGHKLFQAREPPAAELQGTGHVARSAVPALDASSRAAGAEGAASADSSIVTSSPAVAVQDARSAVAAADGGPPAPAEPAAVQAASSSLGAAVGAFDDTTEPVAQLSLDETRGSIVREALGVVSVLARHNAWLVEEAVKTLQGSHEAAMQVGGGCAC